MVLRLWFALVPASQLRCDESENEHHACGEPGRGGDRHDDARANERASGHAQGRTPVGSVAPAPKKDLDTTPTADRRDDGQVVVRMDERAAPDAPTSRHSYAIHDQKPRDPQAGDSCQQRQQNSPPPDVRHARIIEPACPLGLVGLLRA